MTSKKHLTRIAALAQAYVTVTLILAYAARVFGRVAVGGACLFALWGVGGVAICAATGKNIGSMSAWAFFNYALVYTTFLYIVSRVLSPVSGTLFARADALEETFFSPLREVLAAHTKGDA